MSSAKHPFWDAAIYQKPRCKVPVHSGGAQVVLDRLSAGGAGRQAAEGHSSASYTPEFFISDFLAGRRPSISGGLGGRNRTRDPLRSTGPAPHVNLHKKSAPEANSKVIPWGFYI